MALLLRSDLERAQRGNPELAKRPGVVRAGITGSGNSLLVLTWTADELACERAAGVRLLGIAGVRPGMRVANTLAGALTTPGSLQLGDVVDELGALDIPLGSVDSDFAAKQAWDLVDRVQPTILVLDPLSAQRFLNAAPEARRPWWVGTVWACTDTSIAAPFLTPNGCGFAGWQRRWLAVPEVTSYVAMTCEQGRFHLDTALLGQVIDPPKDASSTTAATRLLALSLSNPESYYVTGLAVRALNESCACGAAGAILEIQS